MTQTDNKILKEILDKSLLNTRPLRLTAAGTSSASNLTGYVLQVEEDITITSISCNVRGDIPTTLTVGYYYYKVSSIAISAGACTIYELEIAQ